MPDTSAALDSAGRRREKRRVTLGLVIMAGVVLLGFALAIIYANSQAQRERSAWQTRMTLVAASRAAALADWVAAQQTAVSDVADNPAVQLYLTTLVNDGDSATSEGQRGYLTNLLAITARRAGFESRRDSSAVPANVPSDGGAAGIALVAADGTPLAVSPGMPDLSSQVGDIIAAGRPVLDRVRLADGSPLLVHVAPVYAVQSDPGTTPALGYVLAARPLDQQLGSFLRQPGDTSRSARNSLVSIAGAAPVHLSPRGELIPGNAEPVQDQVALAALATPELLVEAPDFDGQDRLMVAVPVPGPVDWMVLRSVSRAEALGPVISRRNTTVGIVGLVVALVAVTLGLVWRHGASVRVAEAAAKQAVLVARFKRLSTFLQSVTDGQPTAILAVSSQGVIRFANRLAALDVGRPGGELLGRRLEDIFSHDRAQRLRTGCEAVLKGETVTRTDEEEGARGRRIYTSAFLPLSASAEDDAAVLIVREDVTALMDAQERKRTTLVRLVEMLTTLVDARDPHAGGHSRRVAEVADAVAGQMQLSAPDRSALTVAATLLNIGKIFVPKEILLKEGRLSDAELETVRNAMGRSVDLLEGIDFEGPVAETLRQVQARVDGAGDPPLAGDDILPTARILAVANAFVAMASSRAHRAGLPLDEVADLLMAEAGRQFDRAVVAALVHVLESGGYKTRWQDFARPEVPAYADQIQ